MTGLVQAGYRRRMTTFFILAAIALVGLGVFVFLRDRRTSNAGDRPTETRKADWLHKSEGI
ncbi:hypothetical protein B0I29_10316 [Actinoplanes lutulentus]|uniref:Uncharacterized protein n=1 Tax=Actinoplanes lutulentus TaxID=1287878 RepID=A0A327ZMR7_9ACTN|nr:hypothetical protein B0I29_10316 [Actinoplanes lutulentus]